MNVNTINLAAKIPRRKATFIVEKSNVAREMKIREGRENLPTKTFKPSVLPTILKYPANQPRSIVRNI